MSKPSDDTNENGVPSIGVDEFANALDTYGPTETLALLIENSRNDDVLRWLLQCPGFVAFGQFVNGLPRYKVEKTLFGTILIKKGKQKKKSKKEGGDNGR